MNSIRETIGGGSKINEEIAISLNQLSCNSCHKSGIQEKLRNTCKSYKFPDRDSVKSEIIVVENNIHMKVSVD